MDAKPLMSLIYPSCHGGFKQTSTARAGARKSRPERG